MTPSQRMWRIKGLRQLRMHWWTYSVAIWFTKLYLQWSGEEIWIMFVIGSLLTTPNNQSVANTASNGAVQRINRNIDSMLSLSQWRLMRLEYKALNQPALNYLLLSLRDKFWTLQTHASLWLDVQAARTGKAPRTYAPGRCGRVSYQWPENNTPKGGGPDELEVSMPGTRGQEKGKWCTPPRKEIYTTGKSSMEKNPKLNPAWRGPYTVVKKLNDVSLLMPKARAPPFVVHWELVHKPI